MGKEITLFSGYAQRENRTTNYCLLVLKMLYEENPKYLRDVLSALIDEEIGGLVGVQFRQQQRKGPSTPDGLITQQPLTIFIETKHFDWFYDKQIAGHLEALDSEAFGAKLLLALGRFDADTEARFSRIEQLCRDRHKGSVFFKALNFSELLDSLMSLSLPKNLAEVVAEFGSYLEEEKLLPDWEFRLDVVNCSNRMEEPQDGVYLCPAKGGAYKHRRARFFGPYKSKKVQMIHEVDAVLEGSRSGAMNILWNNSDQSAQELMMRAQEKVIKWRINEDVYRIFLLGEGHPTNFLKDSSGGMQTSKQYFSVRAEDAADLARQLDGARWSQIRQ